MNIETEQLKIKLVEAQMMILQYQHKEIMENLSKIQQASVDKNFSCSTGESNSCAVEQIRRAP